MIMLRKILDKGRLRNKNIHSIDRMILVEKITFFFMLIFFIVFNFIGIVYAYSIDPVLSLIAFGNFFGFYMIATIQLLVFFRIYHYLRRTNGEIHEEAEVEEEKNAK
jgi:hypothetical protein